MWIAHVLLHMYMYMKWTLVVEMARRSNAEHARSDLWSLRSPLSVGAWSTFACDEATYAHRAKPCSFGNYVAVGSSLADHPVMKCFLESKFTLRLIVIASQHMVCNLTAVQRRQSHAMLSILICKPCWYRCLWNTSDCPCPPSCPLSRTDASWVQPVSEINVRCCKPLPRTLGQLWNQASDVETLKREAGPRVMFTLQTWSYVYCQYVYVYVH